MEYIKQLQLSRDLIHQVLNDEGYLNILLSECIKKYQLDEQTRRFMTRLCYGVVENKMLIDYYLRSYIKGKRIKPLLKNTLRMAVYGLYFMNITNHHFTNVLVEMVKKEDYRASTFVNFIIRQSLKEGLVPLNDSNNINEHLSYLSIKHSIPLDIVELLFKQYPDQYESIIAIKGEHYNVYRLNLIKTTFEEVQSFLDNLECNYNIEEDVLWCQQSLINTLLFEEGKIVAQDYASQLVARMTLVQPEMMVLDACSAPGSKAMHMATLMDNRGKIVAMDLYHHKLQLIEYNAQKLGVKIIEPLLGDATTTIFSTSFDVVLLDVPCSGLGVMHHKPDIKYRMELTKIAQIVSLQKSILEHMAAFVKVGGLLVYSTCTINKDENENQIKKFLEKHPFELIGQKELLPKPKHDGFAIYQLKRKGN